MLSLVLGHINQLHSDFKRVDDCVAERFRLTDCGNHAAIVVHIGLAIQKPDILSVLEARGNFCHLLHVTSFAVIRHSLKQFLCHLSPPLSVDSDTLPPPFYYTQLLWFVHIFLFKITK